MKKIILFVCLILFCASVAHADILSFAWDFNESVQVDGYRLYLKSGEQYTLLWAGTTRYATVEIKHGTKGDVICRAFLGNKESPDSIPYYISLVGKPKK